MYISSIIAALIWGAITGLLAMRLVDSLLGLAFCLHGLFMSRWKRLSNKAKPGQIKYDIILQSMGKLAIFTFASAVLLKLGDEFVRWNFQFYYQGNNLLAWGIAAGIVAIILARPTWRRLVVVWKMTHEVDYAEKRQRTSMLGR